jgi:hypothetical protein
MIQAKLILGAPFNPFDKLTDFVDECLICIKSARSVYWSTSLLALSFVFSYSA